MKLPESRTSLATCSFLDLVNLRHMVIQELSKLPFWHQQRVCDAKQALADTDAGHQQVFGNSIINVRTQLHHC